MRRCWDDPSYKVYGHALERAVGGGQCQPLLGNLRWSPCIAGQHQRFWVETWFQRMAGQGGEKEAGMKKGMPYSASNSREQVKHWHCRPGCTDPHRMTSYWSLILTFYQYLGRIYEESWSGKITLGAYLQFEAIVAPAFPFAFLTWTMGRGFNSWMKVEEGKLKAIGEIVQMLHNARFCHLSTTSPVPWQLNEWSTHQWFPDPPVN